MNNQILVISINHGHGWIDFYQPTTVERVNAYVKKRGCEQITFKEDGANHCHTMDWSGFKKYFKLP